MVFKKNKEITFTKDTNIILEKSVISKISELDLENRVIEKENSIPMVSDNGGSNVIEAKNRKTILGEAKLSNKSEIFNFDSIYITYSNQKGRKKTAFLCNRVDIIGQQHWVE